MKLHIIKMDGKLIFYDKDSDHDQFEIPIMEIAKTIIVNNKIHSYWVEYFLKNIFIRRYCLYDLVEYINEVYPTNNINWPSQLYNIEYYQELLTIDSKKNRIKRDRPTEKGTPKLRLNKIWSRYKFEKNEDYLEMSIAALAIDEIKIAKIKGKVLVQLTKYNLLKS
ncbi:hypothetical protein QO200_19000 [Flavobacterium sp. Arc3]|uniref:hypothetical protein n=1 Tax=Flavobacterium sp. Arc3 TaxID=3046686 RepID=UPI00352FC334